MRVSTNTLYAAGAARLSDLQSGIVKTQQQISSGRRILTPSDDPIGAARVLDLSQGQAINTQLASNRESVDRALSTEDAVLQGTTSLLQDVKQLTISAGNGALADSDRKAIAVELRGRMEDLLGQANATDGEGNYLFGGYKNTSPPFSSTSSGVQFSGDQGQQMVPVSTSRQLAKGDPGDAIFNNIANTGTIKTSVASGNSGVSSVSGITITDTSLLTKHDYEIKFTGAAQYDIIDQTTGAAIASSQAYTSPQTINFDGQQLTVTGNPVAGDSFASTVPRKESVFSTLSDLINALEKPVSSLVDRDNFNRSLLIANGNIDNALNNVLSVRASVGARQKEIESLNAAGEERGVQYSQLISQIQDLDYTKAISDFTQQNTILEAAQKTFVKTTGLSLFNII